MKFALVNPNWSFDGSIYFGCTHPHLPIEFAYAKALIEARGHEAVLVDAQMERLSDAELLRRVGEASPDVAVVTTAPSYLFWRCAPPELRVPKAAVRLLRGVAESVVAVGPHCSTTPKAALEKLGEDAVVLGECEEVLADLAGLPRDRWSEVQSLAWLENGEMRSNGGLRSSDMKALPALSWPEQYLRRHAHHHHRFDAEPMGPGAEMEVSRGCPYSCSFCAKENFRNKYRKRPLGTILEELDGLIRGGIEYVYFVDEIFLPDRQLLEELAERPIKFGVQTRVDLWKPEMLDLLGRAGCVSIEAGVESITPEGRDRLDKNCKMSTEELTERLIRAKQTVAFVQANLIEAEVDDAEEIEAWRERLQAHGVWANKPVPLFPYPGSPDYGKLWGLPDDRAWERAHEWYLERCREYSDIQDQRPLPIEELEAQAHAHA